MASKAPKKANLLDHHSIKHILDESVSEVCKTLIPFSISSTFKPFFFFLFFSLIWYFVLANWTWTLSNFGWVQVVTSRGYVEDVRLSNVRLVIGAIIIVIALFAQFYKKKFPENRDFLIACIALYPFATILFYCFSLIKFDFLGVIG